MSDIIDDSDDIDVTDPFGDDIDPSLSEAEMELLRIALVQHGVRLGELEARLEQQIADLRSVRVIVKQTHNRVKSISIQLGVKDQRETKDVTESESVDGDRAGE